MARTFAGLSHPDFRRYWFGMAGSNVGTWMQRIAQAWLVLELTASPVALGIVTSLQFFPMLLIGPWAGGLADRWDRRRILLLTQIALAGQAALTGALVLFGLVTPMLLFVMAGLLGLVTAIDAPARQSYVSDLVPKEAVPNAVALNAVSFNMARLVGPALAGLVIAAWGTGLVFVLNAATFSLMILALLSLPATLPIAVRTRSRVWDGVKSTWHRSDLLMVILVAGIVSMFVLNFQVTIAIMATQEFAVGPEVYGLLGSVMAVGSLAGALISAQRARTSVNLVIVSGLVLAAAAVLAALAPTPALFGLALAICGASALTMMTGANSYLQTNCAPDQRSRVLALYMAVFFGTTPLGAMLVGLLATQFGPRAALLWPGLAALVGVGLLVVVFVYGRRRSSRRPQWRVA